VTIKGENKIKEKTVEFGWAVEDLESKLLDPRIWIADTGATAHSTANKSLTKNWNQDPEQTVVVMGNGQREEEAKNWKYHWLCKGQKWKESGKHHVNGCDVSS